MSDQARGEPFLQDNERSGTEADYEALVRLMKENEELKDRSLRTVADMENLRRRTAREVQDARAYAIANFARDLLSVSDNLRRAIEAVPEETRTAGHAGLNSLIEGVEMTERLMLSSLEKNGVKKLEPLGERFDPNFHQAMFEIPHDEKPSNTVLQVVQPGYSIGERVLRPAMVGVSKGGPKPAHGDDKPAQQSPSAPSPEEPAEPGPINEQAEKDA